MTGQHLDVIEISLWPLHHNLSSDFAPLSTRER
ncbi:hypothetical protein BN439_3449 [Erwinia amylovora Ea644]|uniref:Uncharacterized protein n=3 Tax=Erwinia amylovora TaxID=552 RepID=A0A831A7P5_ERWAM|nr:hypothetical protein EaACW_3219 [Erwinia amylovora ACW56400]QJQ53124.1 hypothetical protein EHX00_0417 [Erwinia amylovora]CBA23204.1 hypothetical protein predicted by Glimmer/Critica [Erwinia amylovora CFBP1430]CBX82080.1 hypothetical protein predicted by Glimmer/Critica [Erwinia amylovora ATCC BAA-2158]CCO80058.1 hypothetical protein BN432_3288 [Erwinia amylovora Ea356]CCO83862.1 hypothetical protein BN433_3314 [Erwinia amylovora Ea266]CCO87625.1 hypothetical protein BN434_3265 [Erwinia a